MRSGFQTFLRSLSHNHSTGFNILFLGQDEFSRTIFRRLHAATGLFITAPLVDLLKISLQGRPNIQIYGENYGLLQTLMPKRDAEAKILLSVSRAELSLRLHPLLTLSQHL